MCLLLTQPQEVKPALRSLWGFTPRSSKETSGVDKTGHLLLSVNIRMRCQGGLLRYLRRYMEITTYALYVLGLCYFWNLQFWVQVCFRCPNSISFLLLSHTDIKLGFFRLFSSHLALIPSGDQGDSVSTAQYANFHLFFLMWWMFRLLFCVQPTIGVVRSQRAKLRVCFR